RNRPRRVGQLVPGCRARTVHGTSRARRYELARDVRRLGRGGGPAGYRSVLAPLSRTRTLPPRPRPHPAPAPPPIPSSRANSYLGAELVACTVRARHPGTSWRSGTARVWLWLVPGVGVCPQVRRRSCLSTAGGGGLRGAGAA